MNAGMARVSVEVLAWRHGWAWPLAALLFCAAIVVHFALVKPARVAVAESRQQLAQVRSGAERQPPATSTERLEQVREPLRRSPPPAELLRRLLELARAEGIVLAQGEYHQQAHAAAGVFQLQVVQPVRSSYPQLRRYVEAVLREMPNASLDQISARRDNVGQGQLEVRLRWSFWMTTPGPVTAKATP